MDSRIFIRNAKKATKQRSRDTRADPVDVVIYMANGQTITMRSNKRMSGEFSAIVESNPSMVRKGSTIIDVTKVMAVQLVDLPR